MPYCTTLFGLTQFTCFSSALVLHFAMFSGRSHLTNSFHLLYVDIHFYPSSPLSPQSVKSRKVKNFDRKAISFFISFQLINYFICLSETSRLCLDTFTFSKRFRSPPLACSIFVCFRNRNCTIILFDIIAFYRDSMFLSISGTSYCGCQGCCCLFILFLCLFRVALLVMVLQLFVDVQPSDDESFFTIWLAGTLLYILVGQEATCVRNPGVVECLVKALAQKVCVQPWAMASVTQ